MSDHPEDKPQGDVDFSRIMWLGEMTKVEFRPGDIGVLFYPGRLSADAAARLKAHLEAEMPGHRCIVLEEGMRFGVLAVQPGAEAGDREAPTLPSPAAAGEGMTPTLPSPVATGEGMNVTARWPCR